MKLTLSPVADAEIQEAAQWYHERGAALAEDFLSEVIDALGEVERHPHRFPRARQRTSRTIRHKALKRFPYEVIYQVTPQEAYIVAVAHAARKPGYWIDRLK